MLAVILLDLDGFKPVNDRYGHLAGDSVLQQVARRLEGSLPQDVVLARLGGDEFALLLAGTTEVTDIDEVMGHVQEAFIEPFVAVGVPVSVGASLGAGWFPEHGHRIEALLARADHAMYAAKRERHASARSLPPLSALDDRLTVA